MLAEIAIAGVCIFLVCFWLGQRRHDSPPGPIPFPVVGNLIQVMLADKTRPFVALDKLAQKYGDVMSVRFGARNMLILSSFEALRDTLNKDAWSGRIWAEELQDRYLNQRIGLIFIEGEFWKDQRRFVLRHLRDVGFGKQSVMEGKVREELEEFMRNLEKNMGDGQQTVMYMHNMFNLSFLNVLWTLVAGVRYKHDHPQLKYLLEIVYKLFKSSKVGGGITNIFPILQKIAPKLSGKEEMLQIYKNIQEFIRASIQQHRESEYFGSSNDFMDIYLQEVDKTKDNSESFYTEDQLIMLCLDLFIAGSETTSNTLSFAILYMILNPEIQQKVYNEIAEVVGLSGPPTLDDRLKLNYTEAVLMEVQRFSSVAPFTPPHTLLEDVTFREYFIPKGTPVLLNLYSINMNKKYWADPENFRPERFLDSDNNIIQPDYFIPFGIGKRVCPGESLAKMSSFIYFTTLIQNFKFETVPGHLNPRVKQVPGITLSPEPYHTVITKRHSNIIN